MNSPLSKVNTAFSTMVYGYFKLADVGNVKDISAFISTMETVLKKISFALSDAVTHKMSSLFQLDDQKIKLLKKTHLDARGDSIKQAKIIMDFINESDTNKKLLSGYIEHIIGYLDFHNDAITSNHPFFATPLMHTLLSRPYFEIDNTHYSIMHPYVAMGRNNKPTALFTVNFSLDTFDESDNGSVIIKGLENIKFSNSMNPTLQKPIKAMIGALTSYPNTVTHINNGSFHITHRINDDYLLNVYLPKKHFKLKK